MPSKRKTIDIWSFGENGDSKWYAGADGVRVPCKEETIERLWFKWIAHPNAVRKDDKNFTIFAVSAAPTLKI